MKTTQSGWYANVAAEVVEEHGAEVLWADLEAAMLRRRNALDRRIAELRRKQGEGETVC